MSETMWMYLFLFLGLLGLVLINIFGNVIVSNEQDYYLLKEVTEAAMLDSVDLKAYREGVGWDGITMDNDKKDSMHCEANIPGTVRIVEEKFVESFVRRFAESVQLNKKYKIIIHDIDECPPKVSLTLIVREKFDFVGFFGNSSLEVSEQDIVNSLTGILENRTSEY
ncbi:MAG: hypothetical protein IJ568_01845 [Bacilli bacterium]|nr:hypothetical protein [Bacilli bacterium]